MSQTIRFDMANAAKFEVKQETLARWQPKLAASSNTEISVYDQIGDDGWGGGITAKKIAAILRNLEGKDVTVAINSPGGDMFEGLSIYNMLREYSGSVTVKVVGLAASAASIIAMAGDEIQVAKSGFLMIHNAWSVVAGDKTALRETADIFEQFDLAIADIYATKTGIDKTKIVEMMNKETWLSGVDSVSNKFADSLLPSDEIANSDNPLNALREVEACLAKAGKTRSQARALISVIKGMRDSPQNDDAKLDAGKTESEVDWNWISTELNKSLLRG